VLAANQVVTHCQHTASYNTLFCAVCCVLCAVCSAAVLVHCGAGVSRSACMVMMYLMRSKMWSAQQARWVMYMRQYNC
jgi:protein tyrosine phosphatase